MRSLLQSQAVEAVDIMKGYKVRWQRLHCGGDHCSAYPLAPGMLATLSLPVPDVSAFPARW